MKMSTNRKIKMKNNYWKIKKTETFDQRELNDLVRDFQLPKDGTYYLAAILKKKILLAKETSAYYYRDREKDFRQFFTNGEDNW